MKDNDQDALILFEDEQFRFLVCKHEEKYCFFIKVKKNILSSAWKFFDSELEARVYGKAHVLNYRSEAKHD